MSSVSYDELSLITKCKPYIPISLLQSHEHLGEQLERDWCQKRTLFTNCSTDFAPTLMMTHSWQTGAVQEDSLLMPSEGVLLKDSTTNHMQSQRRFSALIESLPLISVSPPSSCSACAFRLLTMQLTFRVHASASDDADNEFMLPRVSNFTHIVHDFCAHKLHA